MEASIPRRVRSEDTDKATDGAPSSKKSSEQNPSTASLLSSLAPPPPPVSDAPKRQQFKPSSGAGAPLRKSPVPTQSPPIHSQSTQPQQAIAPVTISAASKTLSEAENRTIRNLDKYIEAVSSNMKKKSKSGSGGALERIAGDGESGRRDAGSSKRGGNVDLFGSFLTTSSNRLDFFTADPHGTPIIPPLPNTRLPIFPEDFPANGPKEWPLSWWGIVEPSKELISLHEKIAEESGYSVLKRRRGAAVGGEGRDSLDSVKKEEEAKKMKTLAVDEIGSKEQQQQQLRQHDRSRESRSGDRSRSRGDERRYRDREQRQSSEGERRSLERRR